MTSTSPLFDAWALPPGIEPGSPSVFENPAGDTGVLGLAPTPTLLDDVIGALRDGQRALARRSWTSIAQGIGDAAGRFLDPTDPIRTEALEGLGRTTSLSGPMCERVLDGMAWDWTAPRLRAMVAAEGLDGALDHLVPGPEGVSLRARGLPLTLHIGAGTVPGVSTTSMIRALLVKSAAWVKPGLGDSVLSVLLARAIADVDPELAAATAVTYWPGQDTPTDLLAAVDLVVVYGGNDAVEALRRRLPATTGLVAYHHRLSFGVVARESVDDPEVVGDVAHAVAMFDQRGCVSPHVILVERGGARSPARWAEDLAGALARLDEELPAGDPGDSEASSVQQLRATAELRAGVDPSVAVWEGAGLAFTVVLDPTAGPVAPCLGRTVIVRPVDDVDEVASAVESAARVLQSVGWAGPEARARELSDALSAVGVTRITTFRNQAFPPSWWRHDGKPPLSPLVRWTELDL